MSKEYIYKFNSTPKNFIREKWVEFATETFEDASHDFGILTFPAEAMQDLHLFKKRGFIDWEEVETESADGTFNYRITKGNIRCFEKQTSIYKSLSQRLILAKVNNSDFCAYIVANYVKIMGGSDKTFPVDVVNLDFEGRLYYNLRYPLDNTIKCIFEFQKKHKRNFSFFITWPVVEQQDMEEYKDLLNSVIEANLEDPSALSFKDSFENIIGTIHDLDYERKSVIGVTKVIIKKASQNLFTLTKNEFYVYGHGDGIGKQRMLSILLNFKYDGRNGKENIIYANDVASAMINIIDLN